MILAATLALQLAASPAATGTVVADTLWSQALGTRKQVIIYLPPSYAGAPERRYPVAYYLHGVNGRETDWTRLGQLNVVMDSLAAAGGPEMIVVMPDGDDGLDTKWYSPPAYQVSKR